MDGRIFINDKSICEREIQFIKKGKTHRENGPAHFTLNYIYYRYYGQAYGEINNPTDIYSDCIIYKRFDSHYRDDGGLTYISKKTFY